MALSLAEKANVRRHLRYPLIGLYRVTPGGQTLATATAVSYRYTQAFGQLEWRMNNLDANEEARITGRAYGGVSFVGPIPNVGDESQITFSGGGLASPVTINVVATQALINVGQPLSQVQAALVSQYFDANVGLGFCAQFAMLVAQNSTLTQAGFVAIAPYGTGPFRQQAIPVPEVSVINPQSFTISVVNTGSMSAQITSNGVLLPPYISPDTLTQPIYGYLPILDYLENAYGTATQDLSIDTADVFKARKTELPERLSLYQNWCMKLGEFIDVPLNPNKRSDFKSSGPRAYV